MRFEVIRTDMTLYGLINSILYVFISLLLLPLYHKYGNIKVTKLAEGVPAGGDLDYVDNNTLKRAFSWRRELGD